MRPSFLSLSILPRRIDPRAWAAAYDEVHMLWRTFPNHRTENLNFTQGLL